VAEGRAGALLALLTLEQVEAVFLAQMHQRDEDAARHRHAVGVFEVVAAIARQTRGVLAQRLQQGQQRIGPRQRLGFRMARPDQPGELLGRHFQLVALDPEEVADAFEVERRGTALPAQVLVELRPIDGQLAAHLGNRAVVTAEQLQVFGEVGGHGMP